MSLITITGGVCASQGFLTAGVSAGLKRSGAPDLALLVSTRPASVAGVFTRNNVAAAPVQVSRKRVSAGSARGVVVNSGCANACTGERGISDAVAMAAAAEDALGLASGEMLVCSTGLIGSYLPVDRVTAGIGKAASNLSGDDEAAARAIMTTDTVPKLAAVASPAGWRVGGIAKGAGMIAPNMGTMLAFVTTDAEVEPAALQASLRRVADRTFNTITVDGDTSTNDTLLAFANGAAGIGADAEELEAALLAVCDSLSRQMVSDGEGVTKFVTVRVTGATREEDAVRAARHIAESTLVKTALFGEDANWGRVASAVGNSGAAARFDGLTISMAGIRVLTEGEPAGMDAIQAARAALAAKQVTIDCDLGVGDAQAQILTTDLTTDYVRLNAEYEL
ncbi:MAG TPA: bifunctional glutamate N-acetyltransferase/amino-acid acetyltransferase ArgJ [Actinomycetota bacterium]|nr:bifunctional glutamate N-acetyltransferase/amino-acid acetyltransferase ArgJ [Actinomycetota bacterium]